MRLTYDVQAAMFAWFKDGPTSVAKNAKKKLEADPTPSETKPDQYRLRIASNDFLLRIFPCDGLPKPHESQSEAQSELVRVPEEIQQARLNSLIQQFYFIGPVGERFFHWMFLLGAADKTIIWREKEKTPIAARCIQNMRKWENGDEIWDVPFWRALAQIRDSLIQHLSKSEIAKWEKHGLYANDTDKNTTVSDIAEGCSSEIFSVKQIYTHAKDTFTQHFPVEPSVAQKERTPGTDDDADEQNIRGQLEFEWLITRPYSPRYSAHRKTLQKSSVVLLENNLEVKMSTASLLWTTRRVVLYKDATLRLYNGERSLCSATITSQTKVNLELPTPVEREFTVMFPPDRSSDPSLFWHFRAASSAERDHWQKGISEIIKELLPKRPSEANPPSTEGAQNKDSDSKPASRRRSTMSERRGSAADITLALNDIETGKSIEDDMDVDQWDLNESLWKGLQDVVLSARGEHDESKTRACDVIFCQRTAGYIDDYTGENLFHL